MAYVAPYIDDAGLHLPSIADIIDDFIDTYKSLYGQDIYLGNDSQDYQMIAAYALKQYDSNQLLQIIYNNRSPKTAVGTGLDSVVKINGISRKASTYSTCVVTLTGTLGSVIPAGVATDKVGYKWDLPDNTMFTAGTTIDVTAQCESVGAIEAGVGSISTISTPQKGWTSITNTVAAVTGEPVETDEELRVRQSISVAIPSQNMVDSIIAGIVSVSGVKRYKVYDNYTNVTDANGIPAHCCAAVVEGGLDADVAKQLFIRKGPGGGTYGTSSATYTQSDGLPNTVYFSRPTYSSIDITLNLIAHTGYTSTVATSIQTYIASYIAALDIGYNVSVTGLLSAIVKAITNTAKPEFSIASVTVGKTGTTLTASDVTIAYNEIAQVGTVTITEVV